MKNEASEFQCDGCKSYTSYVEVGGTFEIGDFLYTFCPKCSDKLADQLGHELDYFDEHWSSPSGCHQDCPTCEAEDVVRKFVEAKCENTL